MDQSSGLNLDARFAAGSFQCCLLNGPGVWLTRDLLSWNSVIPLRILSSLSSPAFIGNIFCCRCFLVNGKFVFTQSICGTDSCDASRQLLIIRVLWSLPSPISLFSARRTRRSRRLSRVSRTCRRSASWPTYASVNARRASTMHSRSCAKSSRRCPVINSPKYRHSNSPADTSISSTR